MLSAVRCNRSVVVTTILVLSGIALGRVDTIRAEEAPRSGVDLVGTEAKDWKLGPEWANSKPMRLRDLRGRVVMVRFWTDTCPFCAASLPAMQKLADEFRTEPVTFVGVYHSKPRGTEKPWARAVARAKELGLRFPIAYDHNWQTVRTWWLKGRRRVPTSASFVIGHDGKIAFVHPGPVFYPSDDPAEAKANADYEAIRAALRNALRRE